MESVSLLGSKVTVLMKNSLASKLRFLNFGGMDPF